MTSPASTKLAICGIQNLLHNEPQQSGITYSSGYTDAMSELLTLHLVVFWRTYVRNCLVLVLMLLTSIASFADEPVPPADDAFPPIFSRLISESESTTSIQKGLVQLVEEINTAGEGVPVVVFNRLAWNRTDAVEVESPFDIEETVAVTVTDGKTTYPAQIAGDRVLFVAKNVPAMGYKVFWLQAVEDDHDISMQVDDYAVQNEFFKLTIDHDTGAISSIYDKRAKREMLDFGQQAGRLELSTATSTTGTMVIDTADQCELLEAGPVRALIRSELAFDESSFVQDVILHQGMPRIDAKFTAFWHPQNAEGCETAPSLAVQFPASFSGAKLSADTINGENAKTATEQERWVDVSNSEYGISLLTGTALGYSFSEGILALSLIRGLTEPDATLGDSMYEVSYSILPHSGSWKLASTPRQAYEIDSPLIPLVCRLNEGKLPPDKSYLSVEPANLVVSSIKKSEDGQGILLTLCETDGVPTEAIIHTESAIGILCECSATGLKSESKNHEQNQIRVSLGEYEKKLLSCRLVKTLSATIQAATSEK